MLLALLLIVAPAGAPLSEAHAAKRKSGSGAPQIASAIVVDMNSGSILYSQSADLPRYPASLTKMMTLYVLFGYLRAGKVTPTSELVVTPHAASQAPTKLGLKPGATISTTDAVKALVTQSANDAAVTIAENLAGTEENFARVMTDTARSIGMNATTFRNASGLPNEDQITTARDMATLAAHLIHDYPEYYGVFETRYFTFNGRKYRNHNKLLFGYQGCDGIKTGYTKASGFNLTASVHRRNKHLVAVVLGGKTGGQRDAAMRSVLDRHFAKATDTKPTPAQLLASLVPAPSPPAVQKPAYTLAPPTPAPSAPTAPAAEASTDTPADTATDTEEGDTGDPAEPIKASLTVTEPAPKATIKPSKYQGAFQVQVGAFTSEAEAENRLGMVQQRASDLLDGHMPFTTSFMRGDEEWYRARFAGFSRESAQAACAALKKMSLDCAVMKAE
ncbi:MAG TPA: D-alanyl-D-alanine carboxypeptidase [Methyloceanibacter sp.]|nr:D-alanyl-D-alanine carboxypeptidase [Methyloceanibacter sp.]